MPTAPKTFRWGKTGKTIRPVDGRPSSAARGYDATWQRARLMWLRANPLCAMCGMSASCVDHIVPLAAGGERLDDSNFQSLCTSCHSRKTACEDGGFGRR